jgi:ferric-dicitrate binding protein FerR (iron transport regulator)
MRENSTEYDRVIELMAKQMGKTASPDEMQELDALMSANPSYSYLLEVVLSLKGSAEHVEKNMPEEEVASSGWAHLAERMKAGPAVVRHLQWKWVAAAAVVLLAAAGVYQWSKRPLQAQMYRTEQVAYGKKTMLLLEDGTKVWLNAGSRLVYPKTFSGRTREVQLEGEAFFDVADRARQPFFVHTGKITVRVLGTRFDVKAYKEDEKVSATLISGKIQVIMNDDPEKKILLSPHEKLTVVKGEVKGGTIVENALRYQVQLLPQADHSEAVAETAWMDNKMVFNNETFEDVALQLERRYAVRVEFEDEELKHEHVSGVFEKETLQQALDILKMTTKFNYQIDSNRVRLVANQN